MDEIKISPMRYNHTDLRRFLPVGFQPTLWKLEHCPKHLPVHVPIGFEFDGGSVPFLARLFYPKSHPQTMECFLVHDYLYTFGHSRAEADRTLRNHLRMRKVSKSSSWLIWAGVRLFGWLSYRGYK